MSEINDLEVVDASNVDRWPEGMAPSAVNNAGRADEGLLARWYKDTNGSVLTTGTLTAYVYAANQTLSAYYDGLLLGVDFHVATGASPTINVDALGAKSLVWPNGTALASGDIPADAKVLCVYDGTSFQVLSAIGNASAKDTGVADGNVPAMDATGYPAADGSQITGVAAASVAWANIADAKTEVYDFTSTSDVSIASVTPTGTLWSSSQSIVIPTNGLILIHPFIRIDNTSGANRNYAVGLRINGTDYWQSTDDNGTEVYAETTVVPTAEYRTFRGGYITTGLVPPGVITLDIAGLGISTGTQTVQPIIGTNDATVTQTLKGATVTSRLKVQILDMS